MHQGALTEALEERTRLRLVGDGQHGRPGGQPQDRHVHPRGDDQVEIAQPGEQLVGPVEGVVDRGAG